MHTKNKIKNNKETILLAVGSLLLIIAFILYHYPKILEINNQIYNDIQNKIFKENTSINSIQVDVNVSYIEDEEEIKVEPEVSTPNYIAFLEIDKIHLNQGLLPKTSYYNHVNYHVEILDISDYPDEVNGNFILAAHSGTSNVSYFKNLYKLEIGDIAKVYYEGLVYRYELKNIYYQVKDGSVDIYRDSKKSTLTLVTCTKNDKNSQTIYILELLGVESY